MPPIEVTSSISTLWQDAGLENLEGVALVDFIEKGVPPSVLVNIARQVGVDVSDILSHISMSNLSYARALSNGCLEPYDGEKVIRFLRVLERAEMLTGNQQRVDAYKWLNEPSLALQGRAPTSLIRSEAGAGEVIKLIERLLHGIYT
ncbi:DUF2384 domain-containing protein [Shewanella yunxiaonensis]|uniref:DUF2384 domain-containing protein n=1 Tax=Shewanella yunxiaonensis TaxID=2829809 RepID=A0ABX7YW65_9GAMM|nr:antitoxin Xre/MbcA/ParS toxin-binding domain-containing protein [Shewanella yunxiaonensis]QUN06922.1 DUF2384 domain-containing protein [Shewanella yunxiaonensis]